MVGIDLPHRPDPMEGCFWHEHGGKDWHRVTGSCALSVRGSDPNIAMVVPTQDDCFFFVDHRKRAERVFPRRN